jgi:hypothetical protein
VIIRVLHEGQYELDPAALQHMNELDEHMLASVVAGNESVYRRQLGEALEIVRQQGRPLAVEDLRPSDLILPAPDSSLEEVRTLFREEGRISTA